MDPLTALSLAGSIIQFVDFGCKLVSQTRAKYVALSSVGGELDVLDFEIDTYVLWICPNPNSY
jgi:hypothetical protein